MDHLYSEFELSSKKQWIRNIQDEFKQRSYEDLSWKLTKRIAVSPVYTREDLQDPDCFPIIRGRKGWEIGQIIQSGQPDITNSQIRESLLGGVQAVQLKLNRQLDREDFKMVLEGIHLNMISTHLVLLPEDKKSLSSFIAFVHNRYGHAGELIGTISGMAELTADSLENADLSDQIEGIRDRLPGFKMINIIESGTGLYEKSVEERLAGMIRSANIWLETFTNSGMHLDVAVECIFFTVLMGESYYENIAKMRALRMLWQNLLAAYGAEYVPALCHVEIENSAKTGIDYGRLIAHTTCAMSAALGGADRIFIPAIDGSDKPGGTTFSRRLARNIQHVMQMEVHLDIVEDPLAGSYFIEYLTEAMGKIAWNEFKENPGLTSAEKRSK